MKYLLLFLTALTLGLFIGYMSANQSYAFIQGQNSITNQVMNTLQSTGQLPITFGDQQITLVPLVQEQENNEQ